MQGRFALPCLLGGLLGGFATLNKHPPAGTQLRSLNSSTANHLYEYASANCEIAKDFTIEAMETTIHLPAPDQCEGHF